MRPIDFCTPKPFQLEHSCSAVSQRGDYRAMPCGTIRRPPSYRSLSTPCSFARTSLFARCFTRPETSATGIGKLGAARYGTRPGRIALHGAALTSATGRFARGGVFFRRVESIPTASDTPVASSSLVCAGRVSSTRCLRLGGRQDRFRGRLVKGVRFSDPRCLLSIATSCNPPAPRCGRAHAAIACRTAFT